MQNTNKQTKFRPFHETIVEAIREASDTELWRLATLINKTIIPNGHEEIIAEWKRRDCLNFCGVEDSLLEQKKANAKKSEGKKKSIKLDDLQLETEKLLALLNDRQPGLMSWNEFMQERLQNLHRLTSQALGK